MIDYQKIENSIKFYKENGFNRIEAPWWVPNEITKITLPKDSKQYSIINNNKDLVGSAEQGFLYMMNQGLLPEGKYQAVTPCFREETQGILKRKYFLKNELIIVNSNLLSDMEEVINICFNFFKTQVPREDYLKKVYTNEGIDIEYSGVEIGSYGIRKYKHLKWVYATGCAEPRLTRAILGSQS